MSRVLVLHQASSCLVPPPKTLLSFSTHSPLSLAVLCFSQFSDLAENEEKDTTPPLSYFSIIQFPTTLSYSSQQPHSEWVLFPHPCYYSFYSLLLLCSRLPFQFFRIRESFSHLLSFLTLLVGCSFSQLQFLFPFVFLSTFSIVW